MNLEPIGHPEVSYAQSSKAIALLFGGYAQSDSIDTVRQHFGVPASHTSGGPVSQGPVELVTAFDSHTAWSFGRREKQPT